MSNCNCQQKIAYNSVYCHICDSYYNSYQPIKHMKNCKPSRKYKKRIEQIAKQLKKDLKK